MAWGNNQLIWNATELDPGFYELVGNGTLIGLTPWNGSSLTFDIDGYIYGVYNITLILWDNSGNKANDTVFVTVVDTQIPLITPPPDIHLMGYGLFRIARTDFRLDFLFWRLSMAILADSHSYLADGFAVGMHSDIFHLRLFPVPAFKTFGFHPLNCSDPDSL